VGRDESSFVPCYACGGRAQFWDRSGGFLDNVVGIGLDIGMDLLLGKLDKEFKEVETGLKELAGKPIQRPQPYHPDKPNFTVQKFCETCENLATSEQACLRAVRYLFLGDYIESSNSLNPGKDVTFR
jgi:hypothetical protein